MRKFNSKKVIRVGDRAKIINPNIITRIGYPNSFDDSYRKVIKLFGDKILHFLNHEIFPIEKEITDLKMNHKTIRGVISRSRPIQFNDRIFQNIIKAIAYEYLNWTGFGGRERKIYTKYRRELLNKECIVQKKHTAKTGTYFPPLYGIDDSYDPGGLRNVKTYIILDLENLSYTTNIDKILKIEACNVEKIPN